MEKISDLGQLVEVAFRQGLFEVAVQCGASGIKSVQARKFDDPGVYSKAEKGFIEFNGAELDLRVLDEVASYRTTGSVADRKKMDCAWWEIVDGKRLKHVPDCLSAMEIHRKQTNSGSSGSLTTIRFWWKKKSEDATSTKEVASSKKKPSSKSLRPKRS